MLKKLGVILLVMVFISGCSNDGQAKNDKVEYKAGSFVVDVNNPAALMGFADYAFIAHVEKLGTTMKVDPQYVEAHGNVYNPYTPITVTVIENIKGNLTTNTSIELIKNGGYLDDGTLQLWEDDIFPEVGKDYLFLASSSPYNGESMVKGLIVSGPNSTKLVNVSNTRTLSNNDLYQEYEKALEDQVPFTQQRCKSIYDIDYEKGQPCEVRDY